MLDFLNHYVGYIIFGGARSLLRVSQLARLHRPP